jgi:hypothetical protein
MATWKDRVRSAVRPPEGESPNLFAASSAVFSISAVYLYFAGYVFSYFYYYKGFGVTLESLDLSPQFYFMRAYTVFESVAGVCLIAVMIFFLLVYMGGKLRRGLLLLMLLAAFPVLFHLSEYQGEKEQIRSLCNADNTIQFQYKEGSEKGAQPATKPATTPVAVPAPSEISDSGSTVLNKQQLAAMANDGKLSLLLETKDRLVLFKIPKSCDSPFGAPQAQVYTVLRSDLNFTIVTQ